MKPQRPPWEERIAVFGLALLLVITLANVVTRYFTDESFAWTEEISVFLMVVVTLAGAAAVGRGDRHIRIEFFANRRTPEGGEVPRRGLKLLGTAATTFTFLLLAVLFGRWVADQLKYAETSMGLGVPLWWYGIFIPPLCVAIAARAAMEFRKAWRGEGAQ
ncbi:TRAP transporter small permease [Ramlibacter humi]|uniref:TRAP transporter small permease protein n=1 Tax=Ramlibacter humi TaxID=2530451 RepID=A0A4Z0BD65_9BURK|nr:TRAP transporter small permease [Ramlibacter humi]TFY96329.1 TRAP transporter small permease [Ramlibacter humi]